MTVTSILFEPLIAWWAWFALAGLATVAIGYGLARRAPGTIWRLLVLAVTLAALANPTLIGEERASLKDVAALVIDRSASQDVGDRRAQTDSAAATLRDRLARIEDLDLRVVEVESDDSGDGTKLFDAMRRALADVPPERVAGTIMITDGQVHDLPEANAALPGPLHVLLTGQQGERDRRLVIERAPAYGIVGESLGFSVRIEDDGHDGEPVEVSVRADGGAKQGFRAEIGKSAEIGFALERGGATAFELEVGAGDNELGIENNRAVVVVNGVRDRLRVMLVSGDPSPGLRTWRNLLKADPSVDLIHFTILRPPNKQDLTPVNELSRIPFPTNELFVTNLTDFDLIIFDRYYRQSVLPMAYLANVVDYVLTGGAVLDSAGPSFATSAGLAATPLGAVLPAKPTGRVIEAGFAPKLTAEGLRHPVTAGLPGAGTPGTGADGQPGDPTWGRWFRQIDTIATSGTTLMNGAESRPLLLLDRVGNGRVAQLLSDQSWLWARGHAGGGPQADLLRRLVHWLMKEPDLEENDLLAKVDGSRIDIVRRSLRPIEGGVEVTAPDGSAVDVALVDQGDGRATGSLTAAHPGLYRLRQGEFNALAVVGAPNPREIADLRASEAPLKPAVEASGGSLRWLASAGIPQLRLVAPDQRASGESWIGLVENRQYLVTGLDQFPLLPTLLALALLLGGLMLAWRAEGR